MKSQLLIIVLLFFGLFTTSKNENRISDNVKTVFGSLEHSYLVSETGAFIETVPLDLPPGVANMQPNLAFLYDSRSGISEMGTGWKLSGISHISRIGKTIANNEESDRLRLNKEDGFVLDGQYLVLIKGTHSQEGATYRTENETFSQIIAVGSHPKSKSSPDHFMVRNKNGWKYLYGLNSQSKVLADTKNGNEVLTWSLNRIEDQFGNYMEFEYIYDSSSKTNYINKIIYTGNDNIVHGEKAISSPPNEILFLYDDVLLSSGFLAGQAINKAKLLKAIEISNETDGGSFFRKYFLKYNSNGQNHFLEEILECDGENNCLSPIKISWKLPDSNYQISDTLKLSSSKKNPIYGDFNNDGRTDVIIRNSGKENEKNKIYSITEQGFQEYSNEYAEIIDENLIEDDTDFRTADYNGDGYLDILKFHKNNPLKVFYNQGFQNHFHFEQKSLTSTQNPYPDQNNIFFVGNFKGEGKSELIQLDSKGINKIFELDSHEDELDSIGELFLINEKLIGKDKIDHYSGDFDGDGKLEILVYVRSEKKSFLIDYHKKAFRKISFSENLELGDAKDILALDINSDGNTDLIKNKNNLNSEILLSTSEKLIDLKIEGIILKNTEAGVPLKDFVIGNFNGSSSIQILVFTSKKEYSLYEFNGIEFQKSEILDDIKLPALSTKFGLITSESNDNGISDILGVNEKEIYLVTENNGITNKVTQIEDGYSKFIKIDYTTISDNEVYTKGELDALSSIENHILTSGYTVVKNLHYSNGLKGENSLNKNSYSYSKLLLNKNRGTQGFQSFKVNDLAQKKIQVFNYNQEFPLTGKIIRERLYSYDNIGGTSTLLFDKSNKWDFQTYQYGRLVKEIESDFTLNSSIIPSTFLNQFKNSISTASQKSSELLVSQNLDALESAILLENILRNNPKLNIDLELFNKRTSIQHPTKQILLQSIKDFNSQKLTYFPFLKKSFSEKYELDGAKISSANILNIYSSYGQPERLEQVFDDGSKTITEYEYEHLNDKNVWILGMIKKKTSTVIVPSKRKNASNIEEYIYNSNNGLLISKIREPNNLKLKLTEDLEYDVCGNLLKSTSYGSDNIKRWVEFKYENKYKRFRIENKNAKGHIVKSVYDSRTGQLKETIDPNGVVTHYSYDLFGNLNKKIELDNMLETTFEYFKPKSLVSDYINNVEYAVKTNITGTKPLIKYYDNLGREIGAKGELLTTSYKKQQAFIVSKKEYNERGNIILDYSPQYYYITYDNVLGSCIKYDSNSLAITRFKYDENNRLIKTILPDGNNITTTYSSNFKIDINPKGQNRITKYNSKGAITSVTDNEDNIIHYGYNVWGKIETIKIGKKTELAILYDPIGRKISSTDNNGQILYDYNAFGELTSETQKGRRTELTYDVLGRIIKKESNIDGVTTWSYDNESKGRGFIGKIYEITDYNNQKTQYNYDDLGRPITQTKIIGREKFEEIYSYNNQNKLKRKISKNSDFEFSLDYNYENGILVEVLNNSESVWKLTSLSAKGEKTSERFGNQIYTRTTFDKKSGLISLIYTAKPIDFSKIDFSNSLSLKNKAHCDENTPNIPESPLFENPLDRLPRGLNPNPLGDPRWTDPGKPEFLINSSEKRKIDNITPFINLSQSSSIYELTKSSIIQNIEYKYDDLYNLTNRKTTVNSFDIGKKISYESFEYDHYNRIAKAIYKNSSDYFVSNYDYDNLGNILYNSNFNNKEGYYNYDNDNPYKLVSIQDRNKKKIQTFKYDDYGNVKKISNGTNLDYTSFNKPSKIQSSQGESIHYYDSENRLVHKNIEDKQGQKTTFFYPFNDFEVRISDGKTQYLNSIVIGGNVVSIVLNKNNSKTSNRFYLHKDHLGSSSLITNSLGIVVSINRYDSFGKKVSIKNELPVNFYQGFTGHKELTHPGLLDMEGRIYSTTIGRFLTKDPFVQSPTNFQNYNRYSYVLNNPLNNVDPSGYSFFKKLGKVVSSAWNNTVGNVYKEIDRGIRKYGKQIVIAAVAITVTVYTGGAASGLVGAMLSGAAAGAAASATAVLLNGGDFNSMIDAALTGAATGAISAGIFYGVGSAFGSTEAFSGKHYGKVAAHGGAGGIMSEIRGGNFQDGFLGAAVSQAFSPTINNMDRGNLGMSLERTATSALVGGTASLASGGDFVGGALTASFSRAYNEEMHKEDRYLQLKKIAKYAVFIGKGALVASVFLTPAGLAAGSALAVGYIGVVTGSGLYFASTVGNISDGNYETALYDAGKTAISVYAGRVPSPNSISQPPIGNTGNLSWDDFKSLLD